MSDQERSHGFLSGNSLKIIAAIAMTIDHIGLMFFPEQLLFRVIGRLAFPIFAFMIAEGCKYTRSRRRYFLQLFGLALVCQIVYFIADGSMYLSVLFTFSLSILMIFALQYCKAKPSALPLFALSVACVYALNRVFTIDYGFWGCMLPVFAAALHGTRYDRHLWNTAMLALGLVLLWLDLGGLQLYALAAIALLLCYSGRRGKRKMKYFFYIFYPAHLAILHICTLLLS